MTKIFIIIDCVLGSSDPISTSADDATAGFCLTLPGKTLYLTPLLTAKKFRGRGNKEGALRAFYQLEEEHFGRVLVVGGSSRVSQVTNYATLVHSHPLMSF